MKRFIIFVFLISLNFSGSIFAFDESVSQIVKPVAMLEIFKEGNPTPSKTYTLQVQFNPKENNRSNSPTIVNVSLKDLKIDDLDIGNYVFKETIYHQPEGADKIPLMTRQITAKVTVEGTKVDFGKVDWNYNFDADGDGYANITELMNGTTDEQTVGGVLTKVWHSQPTAFLAEGGASSLPSPNLLKISSISAMAPSSDGHVRVVGDPHSAQGGILVSAQLEAANGSPKGQPAQTYSRIDGSFEVVVPNALVGDKIKITTYGLKQGDLFVASNPQEFAVQELQSCSVN